MRHATADAVAADDAVAGRRAVPDPGFQSIDLGAGMLDGEGFGIVDAQPCRGLLAGGPVGELEVQSRDACRDDADIEAGAFAVIEFVPLGDPLLAHAVG